MKVTCKMYGAVGVGRHTHTSFQKPLESIMCVVLKFTILKISFGNIQAKNMIWVKIGNTFAMSSSGKMDVKHGT